MLHNGQIKSMGLISLKLVVKYNGSGRTVCVDHFFSSFDLAAVLMTKRLAYGGTKRKIKCYQYSIQVSQ